MRTWHAPRSLITPATSLANLIHWRTAGSEWSQLRDAVGAQQLPPLVRPRWMSWLVYGLPLLTGAVVGVGLPSFADWAFLHSNTLGFLLSFAAGVRGLFVIPLVIFSWVLLVGISALFNRSLPGRIRSVGDLVPFVITSAEMTWTREQIEEQVRQIVVGPLQVAMERYRAEGRFVEEFGLENDIEKS